MEDLESILIIRCLKTAPKGGVGGSSSISAITCMLEAICCSNNYFLIFIPYLWRTDPQTRRRLIEIAEHSGVRGWMRVFLTPAGSLSIHCCKVWKGATPLLCSPSPKSSTDSVCAPAGRQREGQDAAAGTRPCRDLAELSLPWHSCIGFGSKQEGRKALKELSSEQSCKASATRQPHAR